MKHLSAFIRKEFRHIFRDMWTTIILLILPILMLFLFGYAITTEVRNIDAAVYDPSGDTITTALIKKIEASEYFTVSRILRSPDEIESAFRTGEIALAILFDDNFDQRSRHTGDAQVQLIADGSDPNTAATLINYATNILRDATPARIIPAIKMLYNPGIKGAYNFVPGVMGMILMLICAMMTSVSIAREKEKGTMEILLVSPMRPLIVIVAKAVPYFILSVVNLTTILLISVYILNVPIAGSFVALITVSFVFILVSLALGLLISSAVNSQSVALLISGMALMIPVILLSGMIFPVENMPLVLQFLSNLVPARWYIAAVKKIMIKGLGFSSVTLELTILSATAGVLITLSLKRFKTRLE